MLGDLVPVTVGAALAFKRRGERRVALTFFGDGAMSTGDVHEGLNLAAVWQVPAVFVVQANEYAYSTPTARQTANTNLSERMQGGWSIPCPRVDGTDAVAVHAAVSDAVERHAPARGRRRSRRSPFAAMATPPTTTPATSRRSCATATPTRSSGSADSSARKKSDASRVWSSRKWQRVSPKPKRRPLRILRHSSKACTPTRSDNRRRDQMADLTDTARRALEGKYFWTLATINPDGSPQSSVVWVDVRDGKIVVNTALGRKKPRNMEQNPKVALSWYDPEAPYEPVSIQGRVVESYTGDRAEADIDSLAKKYIDKDVYPWRKEGERRITFLIEPTHVLS